MLHIFKYKKKIQSSSFFLGGVMNWMDVMNIAQSMGLSGIDNQYLIDQIYEISFKLNCINQNQSEKLYNKILDLSQRGL